MPEAELRDTGGGLAPEGEGWFVVNARDAWWGTKEGLGVACMFEHWEAPFPQLGIRLVVLEPGQPNAVYHSESQQEAFLVLSGECRLIVEGEERLLRPWDFFHCPAGTAHIFVGAGDGPSVILMAGARTEEEQLLYPISDLAAQYGASVEEETIDPDQAYARFGPPKLERPPSWARLPWAE
jgi:uncharacterized cupin superfamily protein